MSRRSIEALDLPFSERKERAKLSALVLGKCLMRLNWIQEVRISVSRGWRTGWDYPSLLSGSLRFAPSRTAFSSNLRFITSLRSVMADRVGLSFASLRLSPLCSESNGVLIQPSLHHFTAFSDGGQGGIRTHGRVSPTHAFQACSLNHSDTCPFLFEVSFQKTASRSVGGGTVDFTLILGKWDFRWAVEEELGRLTMVIAEI